LSEIFRVGMAEYKAARSPAMIVCLGLGSCVGVALYDKLTKIGGIAHVMLPNSNLSTKKEFNPGKFADTAIIALVDEMMKLGANHKKLISKIAGGAQMFQTKVQNDIMQIGKRNVEAVKKELMSLHIQIVAEDTMGNYGRTIELCCQTGDLTVKTIGHGIKTI